MAEVIYLNESDEIGVCVQRKNPSTGAFEPATGFATLTVLYAATSHGSAIDPTLSATMVERSGTPGAYYATISGAAKAAHLTVDQAVYVRITDGGALDSERTVVVRQVRDPIPTTQPDTGIVTIVTPPPPPPPPPDTTDTTPASVTIGSTSVSVLVGNAVQLSAVIKNAAGGVLALSPTSWSSSDTGIATVDSSGLVTGVAAGAASITAHYNALVSNATSATVVAVGSSATDADLPTLLTTTVASTPSTGGTIHVAAGGDLQAALNAAVYGDTITLDHTGTWDGNYVMPAKSGGDASQWITIISDGTIPSEHTQVTPTFVAAHPYPVIRAIGSQSALRTDLSAARWRVIGVEFTNHPTLAANNTWGMVAIGDAGDFQHSSDQVAEDIIYDRCYIHADTTFDCRRGVSMNGRRAAVIDCWIDEIHSVFDAQGIAGWNGPGPFKIVNNDIKASTEVVTFGGADPRITNLVPSDIEIRYNHIHSDVNWKGTWLVKNLLELKNARRVLIEGNVFENTIYDGQAGYAFVLWSVNQQHGAPWCVTEHVTIRNNVIRNTSALFNLAATGDFTAVPMNHVTIRNNIGIGIDNPAVSQSQGRLFQIGGAISQLTIEHNTAFSQTASSFIWSGTTALTDHIIKNNIVGGGQYQMFGRDGSQGAAAWTAEAGPGSVMLGNVIALMSASPPDGNWNPGAFADIGFAGGAAAPYSVTATLADLTLASDSRYKNVGTDGTDPGADTATIATAVSGVGGF